MQYFPLLKCPGNKGKFSLRTQGHHREPLSFTAGWCGCSGCVSGSGWGEVDLLSCCYTVVVAVTAVRTLMAFGIKEQRLLPRGYETCRRVLCGCLCPVGHGCLHSCISSLRPEGRGIVGLSRNVFSPFLHLSEFMGLDFSTAETGTQVPEFI